MNNDLPPLNCGGCRTCCLGDTIVLQPEDDISKYKTVEVNGEYHLAKGIDGNCIYLSSKGCTIHDYSPVMCKAFDCRKYAQMFETWDMNKKLIRAKDPRTSKVLAEGFKRLKVVRSCGEHE